MCIMLYSKKDGEWIKRARGNSLGARTAHEEFCHASHGRKEDSSGPLTDLRATVSNESRTKSPRTKSPRTKSLKKPSDHLP